MRAGAARQAAALAAAALVMAGCDAGARGATGEDVTVLAPASMTEAFGDLADAFAAARPATRVVLDLGGSQQLAGRARAGVPADVLAVASPAHMEPVAAAGLLQAAPETLARTRMAIAVEPGNPLGVTGLEDLGRDDLVVVLAAPEVPAGGYAAAALARAGVEVAPASLEADVRAVLGKVALGEADAGIVYRTDTIAAAGRVDTVPIADRHNVEVTYAIAALAAGDNPEGGQAFVDFARSAEGRAILGQHGFDPP